MLSGVIVKMPDSDENSYVCYEEKEKSQFVLEMVKFIDDRGCLRFNLYYAPILFSKKEDSGMCLLFFNIRFCNYAQRVTWDQCYWKSNGHMVLTYCWRIRTVTGSCDFVPQILGLCVFVKDE